MITKIFSLILLTVILLPNNNINDFSIHVTDCINNAAAISMVHMHVSNKATMQRSACSYNKNLFIIVQALLWIWEIQGPQNLGSVQKLSLTFASRSNETKVHVSYHRPSGSAGAKSKAV